MERGDAACVTDASQPESAVKEDLDYFAQFADTYLLSEGNLAADLQVRVSPGGIEQAHSIPSSVPRVGQCKLCYDPSSLELER